MNAKIHIVYEYGTDLRPHSSSHIRLIRPLTHPALVNDLEVTYSPRPPHQPVDVIIIDRLWRPDIHRQLARELVHQSRRMCHKLIYSIDDNLPDLCQIRDDWPEARHLEALYTFLEQADCTWVSTGCLAERYAGLTPAVAVLPNALDERLLRFTAPGQVARHHKKLIIGFTGTTTHDLDLRMVAPALQRLADQYPGRFVVEIVAGMRHSDTAQAFAGTPLRLVSPPAFEQDYPLYQLWFTGRPAWDIGLAPLVDNAFNRCKSDIKFLEYCAIGAAGIYSNIAEYSSRVRHHETGILAEDNLQSWFSALEELLHNRPLRENIIQNSFQYLYSQRTLEKQVHLWQNAVLSILT